MSSENVETTQQLVEGELPHLDDSIKNELMSPTLKHVPEPTEKIVLPNAEDIEKEKTEQALVNSIETFDASGLNKVETTEKVVLPSAADIAEEKKAEGGQ